MFIPPDYAWILGRVDSPPPGNGILTLTGKAEALDRGKDLTSITGHADRGPWSSFYVTEPENQGKLDALADSPVLILPSGPWLWNSLRVVKTPSQL